MTADITTSRKDFYLVKYTTIMTLTTIICTPYNTNTLPLLKGFNYWVYIDTFTHIVNICLKSINEDRIICQCRPTIENGATNADASVERWRCGAGTRKCPSGCSPLPGLSDFFRPVNFQMLWPLATTKFGGCRPQIVSPWPQKMLWSLATMNCGGRMP